MSRSTILAAVSAVLLGLGTAAPAAAGGLRAELGCEVRGLSWVREARIEEAAAMPAGAGRFFAHWSELSRTGALAQDAPAPVVVVSFKGTSPGVPRPSWGQRLLGR